MGFFIIDIYRVNPVCNIAVPLFPLFYMFTLVSLLLL